VDARILVVEDDLTVAEVVVTYLRHAGLEPRHAVDGATALEIAATWPPDLVVLDLMLPGIDGLEVCRRLRKAGDDTPVLMLTARDAVHDRVEGLDAGADDYLVKPFVFEELIARLQAKLRRPQLIEENVLRWRDLALNPQTRELVRGKEAIDLTQREFDLLSVFMREPRRVFGKDHLLEIVWGHDFEGGPNIVETYISYLRAKIDRPGERGSFIRTVRGVGYGLSQQN
jgi:two-component system, OmpR family, response regulator MprA